MERMDELAERVTAVLQGDSDDVAFTVAVPICVGVDIDDLNIRKGPGTDTPKTGRYTGRGIFTITQVQNGKGSTLGWGKLKSGLGWISLDYCTIIKLPPDQGN